MLEWILSAATILGGLAAIWYFRDVAREWILRGAAREHDIALFKKGNDLIDEEFLDNLLNSNLYNHWCWLADIQRVGHFCRDFSREENQFIDRRMKKVAGETLAALCKVNEFVGRHFFISLQKNQEEKSLYLYPEMRHSDDPEQRSHYERHEREIDALTSDAWKVYLRYRSTVRNRLKV